jgi:hypothetical protein
MDGRVKCTAMTQERATHLVCRRCPEVRQEASYHIVMAVLDTRLSGLNFTGIAGAVGSDGCLGADQG